MGKAFGLGASLFLGWALGANDTANIFGTAVAARLIRFSRATLLTAIFVMIGALVEGEKCFGTIKELSAGGVISAGAATLSAALVVAVMTYVGLPVSSTQCIVGALTGIALLRGAFNLPILTKVVAAWLATPVMALLIAYFLHRALSPLFLRVLSVSEFHSTMQALLAVFGCYGAYTLGANNLANVVGPAVAGGAIDPFKAQVIGGMAIACGALT
ncbi:MAG TPA: inorganic phosphate transporter, partial [Armatimonadetes bacterium]|nr:inorganic phosphate transporter [Armatimonadota bacterium]